MGLSKRERDVKLLMEKYGYTRKEAEALLGKEDDPIHNPEVWVIGISIADTVLKAISICINVFAKRNKKEDKEEREELIV